jgi:hypothetical protein
MDVVQFKSSLNASKPPETMSDALQALWYDANEDWHAAHARAQAQDDASGAWVHAYLHRKEGDASNAAYWYRRAGKPVATVTLEAEWESILQALLGDSK